MSTAHRPDPSPQYLPTTREIREAFAEEITTLGGTVPDVYDDGQLLFLRAVLPTDTEVRPGDRVRAGVAARVAGAQLLVHPYTFRQVCTNGAIAAHALQTRRLARVRCGDVAMPAFDGAAVLSELRAAVRDCASDEAFVTVMDEMRSAVEIQADIALHLMSSIALMREELVKGEDGEVAATRIADEMAQRTMQRTAADMLRSMAEERPPRPQPRAQPRAQPRVLPPVPPVPRILRRFSAGRDRSVFGLMNAVTSVARDTRDPEARWWLEELGGSMPARLLPKPKLVPPEAAVLAGV